MKISKAFVWLFKFCLGINRLLSITFITVRNIREALSFKYLTKIIVDYPGESPEKYFNPAYCAFENALKDNGINVPIVIRKCPSECNCQEQYNNYKEGFVYYRFKTE